MEVNIEIQACIHSFMLCKPFLEPVDCPCCIPFPLGFNGYAWQFVFICTWIPLLMGPRGARIKGECWNQCFCAPLGLSV